ncbi:PTS sugar transporter subunit IIA [Mesoplasma photuris]|uniref:PTS sugar transporter subunit IIA n=1 Tax=Mesoplasma photuris TaxID=217731 RepID=UPI00068EB2B1|nr:PTS sugar transporter subunit IIA [Mesoplasma photuris]
MNNNFDLKNIKIFKNAKNISEAIDNSGKHLLELGFIDKKYIEQMHKRHEKTSICIGNYLAIPHGLDDSKKLVKETGIVVHYYEQGFKVPDQEKEIRFVIGIASKDEQHLEILSNIAVEFSDIEYVEQILNHKNIDKEYIKEVFSNE